MQLIAYTIGEGKLEELISGYIKPNYYFLEELDPLPSKDKNHLYKSSPE